MGETQTTGIGRQRQRVVTSSSIGLGVTLFERVGRSMVLTGSGAALLEHARAMGSAAEDLRIAATGQSQAVDGVVCTSSSETLAACLLWVRHRGHPRTAQDAARHRFVGSDRAGSYLAYLRQIGLPLEASGFSCNAEGTLSNWSLVRSGLGIGPMMNEIAAMAPEVVRVLDEVPPIRFAIWLVTHCELRTARRIRLVFDMLAATLGAEAGSVVGAAGRGA